MDIGYIYISLNGTTPRAPLAVLIMGMCHDKGQVLHVQFDHIGNILAKIKRFVFQNLNWEKLRIFEAKNLWLTILHYLITYLNFSTVEEVGT